MRILIYKAKQNEFVATPLGDILPLCAQGKTREEVIDDLKQQIISVCRIIIKQVETEEDFLHFEECKDSKEWIHHNAIEAEKVLDIHERMYNYKPILYKRDGGN